MFDVDLRNSKHGNEPLRPHSMTRGIKGDDDVCRIGRDVLLIRSNLLAEYSTALAL